MSTSTGSTYSTYLAAHDPEIYALIMTSPNFDLYDQNSKMLTKPWGKKIFRQMMKGDYRQWEASEQIKYYWNDRYRIEGLIALRDLLDQTMIPEVWQQNKTPIFIGYYYKDETAHDKIISITAIHDFLDQIQTPSSQVRAIAYPDSPGHVIGSSYMNPHWESVQDSIYSFVEEVLQILPTQN